MLLLLVEDEPDAAFALSALLARGGHDVTTACDAREALDRAAECEPEVVISDIGLPDMSGWELARAMRRIPSLRSAILIALSGLDRDADRERSLAAGFDAYLVKPVDARTIERCIQSVRDRPR